ncbi:MAG: hypothetical protein ABR887_07840 [Methanoregulaceae archaeon]
MSVETGFMQKLLPVISASPVLLVVTFNNMITPSCCPLDEWIIRPERIDGVVM